MTHIIPLVTTKALENSVLRKKLPNAEAEALAARIENVLNFLAWEGYGQTATASYSTIRTNSEFMIDVYANECVFTNNLSPCTAHIVPLTKIDGEASKIAITFCAFCHDERTS